MMRCALGLLLCSMMLGGCSDDTEDGGSGSGSGGGGESTTGDGSTGSISATGQSTGTMSGGSTETGSSSEASGSSDTGLVMNACGTFDPNRPGDSVIPQDPDDPEIIAACTALCEALGTVPDCNTDATTCLDTCKMRSCDVCPGTLTPLVDCETEMFTTDACSCGRTGAECQSPDGCNDLENATNACGG